MKRRQFAQLSLLVLITPRSAAAHVLDLCAPQGRKYQSHARATWPAVLRHGFDTLGHGEPGLSVWLNPETLGRLGKCPKRPRYDQIRLNPAGQTSGRVLRPDGSSAGRRMFFAASDIDDWQLLRPGTTLAFGNFRLRLGTGTTDQRLAPDALPPEWST